MMHGTRFALHGAVRGVRPCATESATLRNNTAALAYLVAIWKRSPSSVLLKGM